MLLVSALAVACGRGVAEPASRQRWAAEERRLDESLDRLEERLLAAQAAVSFWDELRRRRENVSAIACTNLAQHAQGMALFERAQEQKRILASTRNRVAAGFVPTVERRR